MDKRIESIEKDSDGVWINLKPGFIVRDGNYLSARYYADSYRFADAFVGMLSER